MEDKIYVVTLYREEDLEQFYDDMEANGFRLNMKRPLSRNTHYWMTEEQAQELKKDERVWDIAAADSFVIRPQGIVNNTSYTKSGNFWKDDTVAPTTVSSSDHNWGFLHCAGTTVQKRKNTWGSGATSELVNDSVTIFNDGKHVDVVIVDDPVSYDCEEWESPSSGLTRFVQYQWFNNLNTFVNSIDDDGQTEPTGTITYYTNAANPTYHGVHVAGTVAGKYYGWAREANIYNMAVTAAWSSGQQVGALLIFDYLRAFHLNKAINATTGKKNPTITNHSYGGIYDLSTLPGGTFDFTELTSVTYQGVTYSSGNPPTGGWTQANVEATFGVRFGVDTYPSWSAAIAADVQDAIKDGVVIIGAAGNDNLLMADVNDSNWNNTITISGFGTIYYNRGAWPNSPDSGAINVGALSKYSNFRRSTYTQFGPGVDVFAPGDNILSAFTNPSINGFAGLLDSKAGYGGSNYFYPISGTSMASPQVCGIIATLATNKDRFIQSDALRYVQQFSVSGEMTFNTGTGTYADNTCSQGSPNRTITSQNPRPTSGLSNTTKGARSTTGQAYPRPAIYHQA